MMDINRNCPKTPSIDDFKAPIFTPRERSTLIHPNNSSAESNRSAFALNLTNFSDIQSPIENISVHEQLRLEREIAQQSSVITQDSFCSTYTNLQTMISQMQLKVAAAFLQETEYLQQREQTLEYEEKILSEKNEKLSHLRTEREQIQKEFSQIKDRLDSAVVEVTKFQTDGTEILKNLFIDSRQIDEQLSQLISQSMASLGRSRVIIQSKTDDFHQKSDRIRSEFQDRNLLIRHTESSISMMLDLVNVLNQLNQDHAQDLSITNEEFEKKNQEFNNLSLKLKNHWDIKTEIEQIRLLENEKFRLQKELFDQTLLLENLKTVLGKAIRS